MNPLLHNHIFHISSNTVTLVCLLTAKSTIKFGITALCTYLINRNNYFYPVIAEVLFFLNVSDSFNHVLVEKLSIARCMRKCK